MPGSRHTHAVSSCTDTSPHIHNNIPYSLTVLVSPLRSVYDIYTKYPPLLPEYVHLMCKASIPIPNIETKPHRALSVLSWGTRREAGVMYSFFFFHTTLHHGSDGHTTGGPPPPRLESVEVVHTIVFFLSTTPSQWWGQSINRTISTHQQGHASSCVNVSIA